MLFPVLTDATEFWCGEAVCAGSGPQPASVSAQFCGKIVGFPVCGGVFLGELAEPGKSAPVS
ncbi:MAG: hypothetical protein ACKPJJ_13050 [Planctomycetaceae bacterium]